METSLNTLKNLYAQERGYDDWNDIRKEFREKAITFTEMTGHENAICIRAQKAALENYFKWHKSQGFVSHKPSDTQEFITNPENLIQ